MPENRPIRYAVVIERAGDNYSAYVPDLPVCIATAPTVEDVTREITDTIRIHVDGLRANGRPIHAPTTPVELQQGAEGDDPFMTFIEWAGEADEAVYADL